MNMLRHQPFNIVTIATDLGDVVADVAGGVAGGEQAADPDVPDGHLVPVPHQSDMEHRH